MVLYTCPRCAYSTDRKNDMRNHVNKKKMCRNILSDVNPKDVGEDILNGDTRSRVELVRENRALRKELDEVRSKISNQTNNPAPNVKVNSFESTYLEHLTDGVYKYCIDRMIRSVPSFIKRVHFDPKHPENHNICITNIKDTYVTTFDGTKWILHDRDTFLEDLIDKYEYKLNSWARHNAKEHPYEMRQFQLYLEKCENHGVRDKIKNETKFTLYNNRTLAR